jgi:phosphoribosylglycinamide formyltransferase-1
MSVRWALFLSGRGSTAQALLDQIGDLDIRLVVSSRAKAYGVLRARRAGVPITLFRKESSWDELHETLRSRGINGLFLVGFMRILPADFVEKWQGRIWNVHPSLLPFYPGANAMEKSFEEKAQMGVTLHEVTAEMDAGPVKMQAQVERAQDWSATQLRMARMEQRLLREWAGRCELRRGWA